MAQVRRKTSHVCKVSTGDHVAIVKDKCRDPTLDLWFFFILLIQLDHPLFSLFSLELFR